MGNNRQVIVDQLVAILANDTTGFNARLAEVATEYGIANAITIDWTSGSANFAEVFIRPEQIEYAGLLPGDEGVCALIYTSSSITNQGEERQKPSTFSGKVLLHVDFYLKRKTIRLLRQGADLPSDSSYSLERLPNAIEDAFLATVMDKLADWAPVSFNGDFQCTREPFQFNGDGWQMRIPFQLLCEIYVP